MTAPSAVQTVIPGAYLPIALGSFTAPGAQKGLWTVDVSWGDGRADTVFNVTRTGSLGTVGHTFADPGTYVVTERVTSERRKPGAKRPGSHGGGEIAGASAVGSFTVIVPVVAPSLTGPGGGQTVAAGVAAPVSLGSFSQPGAHNGPWAVDISWGDGSTDTVTKLTGAGTLGIQLHDYANAGAYTLVVRVTDARGTTSTETFTVSAINVPVVTPNASMTPNEPFVPFYFGGFTEGGTNNGPWTVDVSWGDGTGDLIFTANQTGQIPSLYWGPGHRYFVGGLHTFTLRVTDAHGATGSAIVPVYSEFVDPLLPNALGQRAAAGVASPIALGSIQAPKSYPGPYLDDISWGDGSPDTQIPVARIPTTLIGRIGVVDHTYARPGIYTVLERFTDAYGAGFRDNQFGFGVEVLNTTPPTVTPAAEQTAIQGVATPFALGSFTDNQPNPDGWSVAVDWGDQSADTLFGVSQPGSLGSQSHVYSAGGVYTVTVAVFGMTGVLGVVYLTVDVAGLLPPISRGSPDQGAAVGASSAIALGSLPQGVAANGPVSVDVAWGDGSADTVFTVTKSGWLGVQDHTYASPGYYAVTEHFTNAQGSVFGPAAFWVNAETYPPPTLTGPSTDQTAIAGATSQFDLGSASDQIGRFLDFYIDLGDGSPDATFTFTAESGSGPIPLGPSQHVYAAPGRYTVTILAVDLSTLENAVRTFMVDVSA